MGNRFAPEVRTALSKIIDDEINLSVINQIELLGFSMVEQDLVDFVDCSNISPMDENIVQITIDVRRKYKIKLPDAVIAATAIFYSFAIVSSNLKDFRNISGLEVLSPNDL